MNYIELQKYNSLMSTLAQALAWYKEKLQEVKEINRNCIKNGYEPHGSMVSLMLNYNKNIRHLEKRIEDLKV